MGYEEDLRNNFKSLKLEILKDIVKNRKEEYTEEAYQIAVEELEKRLIDEYGDKYYDELEYEKENEEVELNIVKEEPDDKWSMIISTRVVGHEIIDIDKIQKYITIFKEKNIQYVSYFSEYIHGIKNPEYSNSLDLYVEMDAVDKVEELLLEENILLNKEVDEIEELRDVNLDENLVQEETHTGNCLKRLMIVSAIIIINIFLICLCGIINSARPVLIGIIIIINLLFVTMIRKKKSNE